MGTLQSELKKVQTLGNLSFDDEPGADQTTVVTESTTKPRRQIIWEYLLANPMTPVSQIVNALGVETESAYRDIHGMYTTSMLSRQKNNGTYHYSTTSTTYPHTDATEGLRKAWAKRTEMSKSGELAQRYAEKRKEREALTKPTKPSRPKKAVQAAPEPAPAQQSDEGIQMVPTYDPSVVSTWPVSMAKAFYVELKKYFGDT